MIEDCMLARGQVSISACTVAIRSGQWQGNDIAWAYYNRGTAYMNLGEYRRAIEDQDKALRLNPGLVLAKQNRALAMVNLNQSGETYQRSGSRITPGVSNPDLDRGTVLSAQRILAQLGFYDGAIDGIVGPKSRGAVRQFQEEWGYPVTGVIDQRLLGQLDVVAKIAAAISEGERDGSDVGSEPPTPQKSAGLEVQSTGSGFFVTNDGWLLTNRHVVNNCAEIDIVVAGNRLKTARKIISLSSDLALVKADYSPYRSAEFRSGKGIRPGSTVVVMGFPLTGILSPEINVTTGNVSALAGIAGDATVLQHTAPVQPGNSGGPLLDDSGNVVGVVVAKADAIKFAEETGDIPENIAFAIKSSIARDFLDAEGIDYAAAPSAASEDIADIVVRVRPYVSLLLCMR
jgi:S1-C subfamily serine protease